MEKNMENEMETGVMYGLYLGYTGIMEKKMETTIIYWGYIYIIESDFLGWMNVLKGRFSIGGKWGLLHLGEKGLACCCRRLASSGLYALEHYRTSLANGRLPEKP